MDAWTGLDRVIFPRPVHSNYLLLLHLQGNGQDGQGISEKVYGLQNPASQKAPFHFLKWVSTLPRAGQSITVTQLTLGRAINPCLSRSVRVDQ